ncbi:MAG: Gfo/Idh/MocA family protein [Anaerolineae bacterium]
MAKLRVGHVDLDTSHPQNWIPIVNSLGHEVVGVYDGGTVWPKGYAEDFAQKLGVPRVYECLDEMAEDVDLAIIHSANWDLHLPRAKVFVDKGKAVLLDKPIAGNLRDVYTLRDWVRNGARVSGGSSLRFANEAKQYLAKPVDERGEPIFAFAGCGVDEFNYGIHAYSMLLALMGTGVESVAYLGASGQRQIEVVWKNGRRGILTIGQAAKWLPFYATVVSDRAINHIVADSGSLYRALLETLLPYYAGEAPAPLSFDDLIEAELVAMAARVSWQQDGARIRLTDLRLDDPGYDGAAFAAGYRLQRLGAK